MPGRQPQPPPPGLMWLGQALGAIPHGDAESKRSGYALVPAASRPQMLVSPDERLAAWAALHRHSDAAPLKVRVAKELMAWACRTGLAGVIFSSPVPDSAVGLRTGSCAWPDLIAEIFGRRDLAVAISVGQVRPQIKPILHVVTQAGQVLGHIKIGWNDVTGSLIRHETASLTALAGEALAGRADADMAGGAERLGSLRVPRVLHHGNWHGRDVLAVSDVGGSLWYRRRRTGLPASATWRIGRALGMERGVLGTSPFWRDLSDRVERLVGQEALDAPLAAALARARQRAESWHATAELDFGLMHGDWAPWNMASIGSALAVWDWERSRIRGPVGFDGLFFRFQVDLWIRRLPPEQALARTLRSLPETMAASGAAPEAGPAVLRLVILEVALRQLEGVAAGVPVPGRVYRALSGLLAQTGDERWRPGTPRSAAASSPATEPPHREPSRTPRTGENQSGPPPRSAG
jgi:hypothetical protein